MKNHLYSYNGQLYRQKRGAAIGNKLSGSLDVLATQVWSMRFNDLLAKANSDSVKFTLYMSMYYIHGRLELGRQSPATRLQTG